MKPLSFLIAVLSIVSGCKNASEICMSQGFSPGSNLYLDCLKLEMQRRQIAASYIMQGSQQMQKSLNTYQYQPRTRVDCSSYSSGSYTNVSCY